MNTTRVTLNRYEITCVEHFLEKTGNQVSFAEAARRLVRLGFSDWVTNVGTKADRYNPEIIPFVDPPLEE